MSFIHGPIFFINFLAIQTKSHVVCNRIERQKAQLITICDEFAKASRSNLSPYAFTEQGVAVLSSVLRSSRAVEVNGASREAATCTVRSAWVADE